MAGLSGGLCPPAPGNAVRERVANQFGLTLVDVIFSLAFMVTVLSLAVNLLVVTQTGSRQQSDKADLCYWARVVQQTIQLEIRTARSFTVERGGSRLVVTDSQGKKKSLYSHRGCFYRGYIKGGDQTSVPVAEMVREVTYSIRDSCLHVDLVLQSDQGDLNMSFICFQRC